MRKTRIIGILILFALAFQAFPPSPAKSNSASVRALPPGDPLGHFEGPSQGVPIAWTGDGQRISNPSFETGLAPWIPTSYNAGLASSVQVTSPGYGDGMSTRITLFSRNLTIGSNSNLVYDLSKSQVGFSPGARFRAAVFVQNVTGATSLDRIEVALLLTTSVGNLRTVHYLFGAGSVPSNTPTDIYMRVPGFGTIGAWLTLDTNLASDASSFADGSLIDSIQQVDLSSLAQTYGKPNHDPHVKYDETDGNNVWDLGEPVVYDKDADGVYNPSTDTILTCAFPCPVTNGTALRDDPLIRYVDTDGNGAWDTGEPIVYDKNGNGIYEFGEPSIYGTTPDSGTLIMTPVIETTSGLFDRIELYTASGTTNWIYNGGFETVLSGSVPAGWTFNASFVSSRSIFLSGSYSARGTITNGGGEMAQSLDARPQIGSSTVFEASVNIGTMLGSTSADLVDVWLGLVDSKASPASVYYYFKTGDGTIPSNRTDATYHKAPGFGNMSQWLSLSVPLLQEEGRFNGLGFTPPYSIELVVVEIGAYGGSAATTAYFDQFSLLQPGYSGLSQTYFYANNGVNSTYVYSANSIPHGSLSFQLPVSMDVLNVTTPEGTVLQRSDYAISVSSTVLTVTIPLRTFFNHLPTGSWKVYSTSSNAAATLYAQDPTTMTTLPAVNAGSTVNLVSQSLDPSGNPISAATVTISLWNTAGAIVGSWTGMSDNQGLWTATSVILPPGTSPPGTYTLQATTSSFYDGIRIVRLPVIAALLLVTVSIAVSSGNISQGTPITISGTVFKTGTGTLRPGLTVTISYRHAGNSTWSILTTVSTDSSGRYSYSWTPPHGEYEVQASVGDSQITPTQSPKSQVIVGSPGTSITPKGSGFPWVFVLIGAAAATTLLIALLFPGRRKRLSEGKMPK